MATPKPRYSVLDLTYDQIDSIERETGIPYRQWGDDDQPVGKVNPLLYAALTGRPVEDFRAMTPRQWSEENRAPEGTDPEA